MKNNNYKPIKQGRNPAIEALRFLFIIQICLWHIRIPFLKAGYLGVEFFYILSGYFMYYTTVKKYSPGVLSYSIHKLKKFYIQYVLSIIITYLILFKNIVISLKTEWLPTILELFSQILMIQNVGIFDGGRNAPLWFFSVLVYGGLIAYSILRYHISLTIRYIAPISIICFLAYCFKGDGSSNMLEQWNVYHFIPMTLVRGICEMFMGILLGYVYMNYKNVIDSISKNLINTAVTLSIILYICILFYGGETTPYSLIFIPVILLSAIVPGTIISRIFTSVLWVKLGSLAFDIFLVHYPLIRLLDIVRQQFNVNSIVTGILFVILIIPVSVGFEKFSQMIKNRMDERLSTKFFNFNN